MAYSTCCGSHTNFPELGICPDCLEHCDWEEEDDDITPLDELDDAPLNELKYIEKVLHEANEYKLTAEVIWSALQAMKQAPNISIEETMFHGLNEWVK